MSTAYKIIMKDLAILEGAQFNIEYHYHLRYNLTDAAGVLEKKVLTTITTFHGLED